MVLLKIHLEQCYRTYYLCLYVGVHKFLSYTSLSVCCMYAGGGEIYGVVAQERRRG